MILWHQFHFIWEFEVKGFLTSLINAFPIGPTLTRIGMVGFSSSAWLLYDFNRYNNSRTMIQFVKDMDIRGGEANIAQVRINKDLQPH